MTHQNFISPTKKTKTYIEEPQQRQSIKAMLTNKKERLKRLKNKTTKPIPQNIGYKNIPGLSNEVKEKLIKHKPQTIGHASKIEGVTPAAVNLILIQIKKKELLQEHV